MYSTQVYLYRSLTEMNTLMKFSVCETLIHNPLLMCTKHLCTYQLYWAILLTEFRQSCKLFHSYSKYVMTLTCNRKNFSKTTHTMNSNIWNLVQFVQEAQRSSAYILVPGCPFTPGERTSDIHCTGSQIGPRDLLEVTTTNTQEKQKIRFQYV